jgi:hypothetical protein
MGQGASKPSTAGQADQGGKPDAKKMGSEPSRPSSAQSPGRAGTAGQAPAPSGSAAAPQGQAGTSVNVKLTDQQRTQIRQTVIQKSDAPKVSSVNFSLKVGTVVPRTVKIVPVPETLVLINPAWRGHMFFIANDKIIIVEARTMKIVAIVEV